MKTSYLNFISKFFSLALLLNFLLLTESKKEDLNTHNELLKSIPNEHGVYYLNEKQYHQLVRTPRNFSLGVAFTVLDKRYDCTPCRVLDDQIKLIATELLNKKEERLILASLDYVDAPKVFLKFGMQGAPNFLLFPKNEETSENPPNKAYNGNINEESVDDLADFLTRNLDFEVSYYKPVNTKKWALNIGLILALILSIYQFSDKMLNILQNRRLWSAITLVFILTMISGQMWNSIRHPPHFIPKRDGTIVWLANGFQEQYVMESHVVAITYGIAAFAIIFLARTIPTFKNGLIQSGFVFLFLTVTVLAISFLSSLFKMKFPHYPFRLFL